MHLRKKKDDIISEIEESKNKKNDNKADDDFLNSERICIIVFVSAALYAFSPPSAVIFLG